MKKSLLILLCLSLSYFLNAQETEKQKEIGIVINNLDNFGITYKIGTEKSLWRFNTLFLSGNNRDHDTESYNRLGFGIGLGKEYRKGITDKLELRFGADLSFIYTQLKYDYDDRIEEYTEYNPGIYLVFGFNFLLKDNFIIGAEILPDISYSTGVINEKYLDDGTEVKTNFSGFNYGLSNNSALLSFAYRF